MRNFRLFFLVVIVGLFTLAALGCEVLGTKIPDTLAPGEVAPTDEPVIQYLLRAGPVQLTTNSGDDFGPTWDPRGETIAYMKSKAGKGAPFDIGAVAQDGSSERVLAVGPDRDIGIAGELS